MTYAHIDADDNIVKFSNSPTSGIPIESWMQIDTLKTKLDIDKELALNNTRLKYQAIVDKLTASYNDYEIESFVDQRAEWKLFTTDPTSFTPIVDALAAARAITREELFQKIELNVLGLLNIQGAQNATEAAIKASTSYEELDEAMRG